MAEESKSSTSEQPVTSGRRRRRSPENAIEPVVVTERHRADRQAIKNLRATLAGAEPLAHRDDVSIVERRAERGKSPAEPDPWRIPDDVAARFVRVGRSYYFQNGAPAFDDHGRKLSTKSENTELVRNLVQIAEARGWEEITVSGTERFRQKAWKAAALGGIAVRGYTPTELEQAQVVRALARQMREQNHEGAVTVTGSQQQQVSRPAAVNKEQASPQSATSALSSAERPAAPAKEAGARAPRQASEEVLVGRLLAHGQANFKFKPDEDLSYYVKVRTDQGDRIRWGRDLQRALEQAATHPKVGDLVGVQRTGQEPVTVTAKERDREGRVIGEGERTVQRNRWAIEKASYFAERAVTARVLREAHQDVQRVAREHPELAGTYLTLKAAEEFAAERIQNHDERKRFVAAVADKITRAAERGEPLPRARLKDRSRDANKELPGRNPERDFELAPG